MWIVVNSCYCNLAQLQLQPWHEWILKYHWKLVAASKSISWMSKCRYVKEIHWFAVLCTKKALNVLDVLTTLGMMTTVDGTGWFCGCNLSLSFVSWDRWRLIMCSIMWIQDKQALDKHFENNIRLMEFHYLFTPVHVLVGWTINKEI